MYNFLRNGIVCLFLIKFWECFIWLDNNFLIYIQEYICHIYVYHKYLLSLGFIIFLLLVLISFVKQNLRILYSPMYSMFFPLILSAFCDRRNLSQVLKVFLYILFSKRFLFQFSLLDLQFTWNLFLCMGIGSGPDPLFSHIWICTLI